MTDTAREERIQKGPTKHEQELASAQEDGRVGAIEEIVSKIEDLIWRRKILDKPYDQLEDIQRMVEDL